MTDYHWQISSGAGSWFQSMRWFPVGVPTASDNAFMDAAYFGTPIAAHISNATAVASTLTIDANNEVIVYSGGILNVTHSITVDGSGLTTMKPR